MLNTLLLTFTLIRHYNFIYSTNFVSSTNLGKRSYIEFSKIRFKVNNKEQP